VAGNGPRLRHLSLFSEATDRLAIVEGQAWAAVGLPVATMPGTPADVGKCVDGLRSRPYGRIEALSSKVRAPRARIDELSRHIDGLWAPRYGRGSRLAGSIYEMAARFDDHPRRHAS
jgi:hypothetical protein